MSYEQCEHSVGGFLARVSEELYGEDAAAVLYGVTGTSPGTYGGVSKDEALECAGALLERLRALVPPPSPDSKSTTAAPSGSQVANSIKALYIKNMRSQVSPDAAPTNHEIAWCPDPYLARVDGMSGFGFCSCGFRGRLTLRGHLRPHRIRP